MRSSCAPREADQPRPFGRHPPDSEGVKGQTDRDPALAGDRKGGTGCQFAVRKQNLPAAGEDGLGRGRSSSNCKLVPVQSADDCGTVSRRFAVARSTALTVLTHAPSPCLGLRSTISTDQLNRAWAADGLSGRVQQMSGKTTRHLEPG